MRQVIKPVDLVILADTSESMEPNAQTLLAATKAAVEEARKAGHTDIRVVYLGIEGTFPGSEFDTSIREYLTGIGVKSSQLKGRKAGSVAYSGAQEDVARAVQDISQHFDWREGAERKIMALGNESLEGGGLKVGAAQVKAREAAVAAAKANNVTVFSHLGAPGPTQKYPDGEEEKMRQEYLLLATATGGSGYFHDDDLSGLSEVLKQAMGVAEEPEHQETSAAQPGDAAPETAPTPQQAAEPSSTALSENAICSRASEIIKAVNTQAEILDKLLAACGPAGHATGGCRCRQK